MHVFQLGNIAIVYATWAPVLFAVLCLWGAWRGFRARGRLWRPPAALLALVALLCLGAAAAGMPVAMTNAQLGALPSYQWFGVMRMGVQQAGDAPPQWFIPSTTACAIGGGDGGSQIPSADGKCWVAHPAIANPAQWGADASGSADATNALQAAFNFAAASGTPIALPPGTYKLSNAIAVPLASAVNGFSLQGSGAGASTLKWTNASGGLAITLATASQSVTVRDLDMTTTQQGGGVALSLNDSLAAGNFSSVLIDNLKIHGADALNLSTDYWNTAILVGVSNVNITSSSLYGDNGLHPTGIDFEQNTAGTANYILNVRGTNVFNMNKGLIYGTNTQGVTVTGGSNFVSGNYGIYAGAGATNLDQLNVSDSSFATCIVGIDLLTGVPATMIHHNTFIPGQGGHAAVNRDFRNAPCAGGAVGLNLAGNAASVVTGNSFQAGDPTSTGISISNGSGRIEGNSFQQLNVGINNTAGSQYYTSLMDNTFQSNVTTVITNSHFDEVDGYKQIPMNIAGDVTAGTPTYLSNKFTYSRRGQRVDLVFRVGTSAWSGSPATYATFTGLPFANNSTDYGTCTIPYVNGITLDAGYSTLSGRITPNATTVLLYEGPNASGVMTQLPIAKLTAASNEMTGACYYNTNAPSPNGGN
jgi:nitrous oxidase accessory protein NosD